MRRGLARHLRVRWKPTLLTYGPHGCVTEQDLEKDRRIEEMRERHIAPERFGLLKTDELRGNLGEPYPPRRAEVNPVRYLRVQKQVVE